MPRAAANGIDIEYETFGRGQPLILIMGISAQLIHWPAGLCQALASRGFQVIRFDNRDAGLSTKLDHLGVPPIREMTARRLLGLPVPAPYTLSDMARDVVCLMDALGIDSAHVVGASLGGMIAQLVAIEHSHRVRSLTSMMSNTGERRYSLMSPAAIRTLFARTPRNRDDAIANAFEFAKACGSPSYPLNRRRVATIAGQAFDRGYHPRGFLRQYSAVLATGPRTAALRRLEMPALVIHGTDDPLVLPIAGKATARAIPGARLRLIEGMGHDLPEGAWPLMADSIRSLALG